MSEKISDEDMDDIRAAKKALAETGSTPWEEVKLSIEIGHLREDLAAALAAQKELLDVLRRVIDDHLGITALDNYNASEALALLMRFGLVKQVATEDGGKFEWVTP